MIDAVVAAEQRELVRRERLYRGSGPPPDVRGRIVILVDDGLATGSTMRAAARALRQERAARVVAGVPVASSSVCDAIRDDVDEIVCGLTPELFYAVGLWYEDFAQTSDEEVQTLLAKADERVLSTWSSTSPPETARQPQSTLSRPVVDAISTSARPLTGAALDYDEFLKLVGEARFVLIGKATHGTHDLYHE